jgi:hypothetical protein
MWRMVRDPSLTDDEQSVLLLHPHWKTLIGPALLAVIVLAAALLVEAVIPAGKAAGEHGQIVLGDIPRVEVAQATLYQLLEEEQHRLEREQRNQP